MVRHRSDVLLFSGLCVTALAVGACTPVIGSSGSVENSTPSSGTFPFAGTQSPPGVDTPLGGSRVRWSTPTQLVIVTWAGSDCYPVPTGYERVGDQRIRIATVQGLVIAPGLAKVSAGGACQASLAPEVFGFTNPGISSDKPGTVTITEQRPGRPRTEESFEVAAYTKT